MNNKTPLIYLLDKYLNDFSSESEMDELLILFKRAENESEIKKLLSENWKQLSDSEISNKGCLIRSSDKWFEEVYSEAQSREKPLLFENVQRATSKKPNFLSYNHNYSQWIKVVAILLFSVLLSLVYYAGTQQGTENSIVYKEKVAMPGEKVRFILSDGTQVHLNSGSRLEYPTSFNGPVRQVRLEGEAFFNVTYDKAHPFIVQTKEITTKVLGTSFDIRSFPEDNEVLVAVAEGKVALQKSDETFLEDNYDVVLEANQWTNYSSGEQSYTTQIGDISTMIAWNKDILSYKNEKLGDVAYQLERWYGVNINFTADEIKDCVVRGEHREETLENVLETITYAFVEMEFQLDGRQVTISGKGCKENEAKLMNLKMIQTKT